MARDKDRVPSRNRLLLMERWEGGHDGSVPTQHGLRFPPEVSFGVVPCPQGPFPECLETGHRRQVVHRHPTEEVRVGVHVVRRVVVDLEMFRWSPPSSPPRPETQVGVRPSS